MRIEAVSAVRRSACQLVFRRALLPYSSAEVVVSEMMTHAPSDLRSTRV